MSDTTLEALEPVLAPFPLSPGLMERLIRRTEYHMFSGGLTVCALTMRNGFVIIGKSAPLDPDHGDELLGQALARADAVRQAVVLETYHRCSAAPSARPAPYRARGRP
jgi:hypothetical protein